MHAEFFFFANKKAGTIHCESEIVLLNLNVGEYGKRKNQNFAEIGLSLII